jgi:cysteine-rich repeat protein
VRPARLDHYECYRAQTAAGTTAFTPREIALDDRFESKLGKVLRTAEYCAPVDVDGEGIVDPAAHLVCYTVRDLPGQPRFARRTVAVEDRLGPQELSLRPARRLCVPATRDGVPPTVDLDHFKCYAARRTAGNPRLDASELVLQGSVASGAVRVVRPASVCVAAEKNGEGVHAPASALHCYATRAGTGRGRFTRRQVTTTTQFGSETLTLRRPATLCMPFAPEALPACGDSVVDAGEECDDGNRQPGDGCDPDCMLERCGDGVQDAGEACDAGAANGHDLCCSADCRLVDPDEDGVCSRDDLCPADPDNDGDGDGFCVGDVFQAPAVGGGDPCSRRDGGGDWLAPRLVLGKLDRPGSATLSVKGTFVLPPHAGPLAPDVHGMQLRVVDRAGRIVIDEHVRGGTFSKLLPIGWKVRGNPPVRWTYLDRRKTAQRTGPTKIVVADMSHKQPGRLDIVVAGKGGRYAIAPGDEPVTLSVELNDRAAPPGATPGIDACAEIAFAPSPLVPGCAFSRDGAKLLCR